MQSSSKQSIKFAIGHESLLRYHGKSSTKVNEKTDCNFRIWYKFIYLKIFRPGLGQRIYFSTTPFNQYLKRKIKCREKNLKIVY